MMGGVTEGQSPLDPSRGLVELGLKACDAYRRPDLAGRLHAANRRLTDPSVRVLVVGEFKQGKSTLVNALVGVDVCPVDGDVATCVPTVVRHAREGSAVAWVEAGEGGGDGDAEVQRVDVPLQDVWQWASELGNPGNTKGVRYVEIGLPNSLLERGLTVVDTPGVGGLGSLHGARTVALLPTADAVVFVTDASQEFTEPELKFLMRAQELCPVMVCALTKVDLYPEWRKVQGLDREHLDERGLEVPMMPIASSLRRRAVQLEDRKLNAESGFVDFVTFLRDEVIGGYEAAAIRGAAGDVLIVARDLERSFQEERAALADSRSANDIAADLHEARTKAERLRSEAARWQVTLSDGVADLGADVDHDFRNRLRRLTEESETRIDEGDPGEWWDEFKVWLEQAASDEVVENYTMLVRRAEELTEVVIEHFAAAEDELGSVTEVRIDAPVEIMQTLRGPIAQGLAARRGGVKGVATTAANSSLTALRGSYGGFLMFSMIGGMIGLGPLSPAIVGLTLVVGRKSMKEEKQRRLAQRRQEAKLSVRKFLDEVSFQVGKDSRDSLRRVHRHLRDTFSQRAEEVQRSLTDRLRAAEDAARVDQQGREARLRDVEAEIQRVRGLAQRALEVAPALAEEGRRS